MKTMSHMPSQMNPMLSYPRQATAMLRGGDTSVPGAGGLKTMPVASMSPSSRVSPSRVYPGYADTRYLHLKDVPHYGAAGALPYLDGGYSIRSSSGEIKRRLTLLPAPQVHHSIHHDLLGPPIANQADRGHPPVTYYSPYVNEGGSAGSDGGPPKKPRLCIEPKSDMRQPLHVDTDSANNPAYKKDCAYIPQVEAISPTLPGEGGSAKEESPLKATKDDLLSKISKVDRDIALAESNISKLKKKQQELEEAAKKPEGEKVVAEEQKETKHQSIAHKIYADNKKKADESHRSLRKLGPEMDLNLPLYNQPSDTELYHENRRKYQSFKRNLLEYFKKDIEEKGRREKYLVDTYSQRMQTWLKRVDRIESSKKKKERDAKARELYEKVFPELRKQREDKERFSRVGTRIKSDAELEEIMDGLQEQELEEKKMRNLAVIAPILLEQQSRQLRFRNGNSFIEDPKALYLDKRNQNIWTEQEKEIFKEKFLQHPKNFGAIAQYLERKNVMECVQYYYLSKKKECYKQLLRKSRQRTRAKAMQKPQAPPQFIIQEIVGANTTGVTTRGSVAAMQRERQQPGEEGNGVTSTPDVPAPEGEEAMPQPEMKHEVPEEPLEPMSIDQPKPPEPVKEESGEPTVEEQELPTTPSQDTSKPGPRPHQCCMCNAELQYLSESRAIVRAHASQYGLEEEALPTEPRICNSCHCQTLRKRCAKCPIPTCPTPKSRAMTRLRSLPSKWRDLDAEQKESIIKEFEIPPDIKRCCSACFNRIARKIGSNTEAGFSSDGEDGVRWADNEIGALRQALSKYGRQWDKVAEAVRTKNNLQCEVFYRNNRKTHRLYLLVREYRKSVDGKEGEASDESTESSEEFPPGGSDTASASSPARPSFSEPSAPVSVQNKEDYDSSATVSADEGQGEMEEVSKMEYLRVPQIKNYSNSIPVSAIKPDQLPVPQQTAAVKIKDVIDQTISRSLPVENVAVPRNSSTQPTIESILGRDDMERLRSTGDKAATVRPREQALGSEMRNYAAPLAQTPEQVNPEDLSVRKTPRRSPPPSHTHGLPSGGQYREPTTMVQRSPETFQEPKKQSQPPPPAHSNQPMNRYNLRQEYYSSSSYKIQSSSPQYNPTRISSPIVVRTSQPPKAAVKSTVQQPPPPLIATTKHPANTPSPKMKGGSITHGTPVQPIHMPTSNARYDGGSITQGTPVASGSAMPRPALVYERSQLETYFKRSPQSFPYARPPAPTESQLSATRQQIIMDDYVTSKNMPAKKLNDKEQPPRLSPRTIEPDASYSRSYYPASTSGYPGSGAPVFLARHPTTTTSNTWHQSSTTPPHQRQVIVQRTSFPRPKMERYAQPKPQSPRQYMPPGHEAFTALVDAAAAQSSLQIAKEGEKRTVVERVDPRFAEYPRLPKQEAKPQAMAPKCEGPTLTAANLIDAIITHSINQGASEQHSKQPANALFSNLSSKAQPDPGKHSPYKVRSPRPEQTKEVVTIEDDCSRMQAPVPGKGKTLGEQIESIIECGMMRAPHGSSHFPDSSQAESYHMQPNWKRRKAEESRADGGLGDERQIIRVAQPSRKPQTPSRLSMEPVSPPIVSSESRWVNGADGMTRVLAPPRQGPASISPLDYVKNKIVEVMRTSSETQSSEGEGSSTPYKRTPEDSPAQDKRTDGGEKGEESPKDDESYRSTVVSSHLLPPQYTPPIYQYPYNALSVRSMAVPSTTSSSDSKPVYTSQYEPLSDED